MLSISGSGKKLQSRCGNEKLPHLSPKSKLKGKTDTTGQGSLVKKTVGSKKPTMQNKILDQKKCWARQVEKRNKNEVKQLSIIEFAKLQLGLPAADDDSCGKIRVRFNHYNKLFPLYNGVLKWTDVDEEYALSFVYRGNYERNLVLVSGNEDKKTIDPETEKKYASHDENFMYYVELHNNDEYRLEVVEDPVAGIGAEGLRLYEKPLQAAALGQLSAVVTNTDVSKRAATLTAKYTTNPGNKCVSGNRAVDQLTDELKALNTSELISEQAKDLIERRDIEEILYS